jgi:LysM repeat protein
MWNNPKRNRLIRAIAFCFLAVVFLAGCSSKNSLPTSSEPILTELSCLQMRLFIGGDVACKESQLDGILLQTTDGRQQTINIAGTSITFDGTIFISAMSGERMTIATLAGISVVGANGTSRIIQPGAQTQIPLGEDSLVANGFPSEPAPYNLNIIRQAPLEELPQTVVLPPPIAPVVHPVTQPTAVGAQTGCQPRDDWGYLYTVQRGDTLSGIASDVGVQLSELQEGNCIVNPNRLSPGGTLRIPVPSQTGDSAIVGLLAEKTSLNAGECTTIQWDVPGASLVYFEGSPVPHTSSQQVCPQTNATFTLLVVTEDGVQTGYILTVTVIEQR